MNNRSLYFLVFFSFLLKLPVCCQIDTQKLFILGNSTIDHRPPAQPVPSDETTVPHWIYLLALEANQTFAAGGQYGFLTQFDDFNWFSQWGYDIVPASWDDENQTFAEADHSSLMITTANFIQYKSPSQNHPLDQNTSVVAATEIILDHAEDLDPALNYYLYQNWPEMDLADAFPPNVPSDLEVNDFHNLTSGSYHNWWLNYQDQLLSSRPELNIRLIPVGEILAKIQRDLLPNQIPFEDLYEDSAPHGTSNLYFLSGLICYMALYETEAPELTLPDLIHPVIQDNYDLIRDFIWNELLLFNLANGDSRVFNNNLVNSSETNYRTDHFKVYPNPSRGQLMVSGIKPGSKLSIYNSHGHLIQTACASDSVHQIDISKTPAGIYIIQSYNEKMNLFLTSRFVKD